MCSRAHAKGGLKLPYELSHSCLALQATRALQQQARRHNDAATHIQATALQFLARAARRRLDALEAAKIRSVVCAMRIAYQRHGSLLCDATPAGRPRRVRLWRNLPVRA